jgi:hypothetical protein
VIDPTTPSILYAGNNDGLFVLRSELFFPQIADGTAGTLRFQSSLILVNTGPDCTLRVEFYRSPDGEPMALSLGDLGANSAFELELGEGESVSLSTAGTGDIKVGYARVVGGNDIGGVVVFRRSDLVTGISFFEAGVPASEELRRFSLFVDSLGTRDTGFALVFPHVREDRYPPLPHNASVAVRLFDKQYNFLGQEGLPLLEQGSHIAKYVHELFDDADVKARASEMQGILEVESSQPLVAVTVRQNDDPAREFPEEVPFLTTFPVIPGIAGDTNPVESDPSTFFFPQLGDGVLGHCSSSRL